MLQTALLVAVPIAIIVLVVLRLTRWRDRRAVGGRAAFVGGIPVLLGIPPLVTGQWLMGVVLIVLGLVFGISLRQVMMAAPSVARERKMTPKGPLS